MLFCLAGELFCVFLEAVGGGRVVACGLDSYRCWLDVVGRIVIGDNNSVIGGVVVGPSAPETVMNVSKEDIRRIAQMLFFLAFTRFGHVIVKGKLTVPRFTSYPDGLQCLSLIGHHQYLSLTLEIAFVRF